MNCPKCSNRLRIRYYGKQGTIRTKKYYCAQCDEAFAFTISPVRLMDLKAALAFYYEAATSEKDEHRNPYVNRKRYATKFNRDIEPRLAEHYAFSEMLKEDFEKVELWK